MLLRGWRWLFNRSSSSKNRRPRHPLCVRPSLEPLEDRTLPAVSALNVIAGPDAGFQPLARILDSATGVPQFDITAYEPSFLGGVRVAVGDVDNDGFPDVITGPGPGRPPMVNVYSGNTMLQIASFLAYGRNFTGGVFVAAGNFDTDPADEVVVGPGKGRGPLVRIFDIVGGFGIQIPGPLGSFRVYSGGFRNGVHVAAGNFDGQPGDELIVARHSGGGLVKVFQSSGALVQSFRAYQSSTTGVYIDAGDVDGDGREEIITGRGMGGPLVRVFNGGTATQIVGFRAYGPGFTGGVRVGTIDADGDQKADIVTGPGPGLGPNVRIFDGQTLAQLTSFFAFDPVFQGGIFVAGG
ncbi:MAG TPA: hypothetical protein VNK04_04455 [Gemmataceae bacterium]|nr:hypothetical protein [Gemmataceae bacterium]